jgi:hypothetical protein
MVCAHACTRARTHTQMQVNSIQKTFCIYISFLQHYSHSFSGSVLGVRVRWGEMQPSIFHKYSITITCHSIHNPHLTNLKEHTHSLQPNCSSACHEISHIMWNVKVHYCIHNSPPLVPTLSQINPIHAILSYLRSTLIQVTSIFPFFGHSKELIPVQAILMVRSH